MSMRMRRRRLALIAACVVTLALIPVTFFAWRARRAEDARLRFAELVVDETSHGPRRNLGDPVSIYAYNSGLRTILEWSAAFLQVNVTTRAVPADARDARTVDEIPALAA